MHVRSASLLVRKTAFSFALILSIVFTSQKSFAQFATLSPQAKVSLVTIGPGQELYSGFGHSVLWIYDPVTGLDNAYNYGTFSFKEGNFYVKFLRELCLTRFPWRL